MSKECCRVEKISSQDIGKIAEMIYDEWLSDPERESFSVIDRLATTVSQEVAKFALYEILRVVERNEKYKDAYRAIVNLVSGLDCETHREKALGICRNIALHALSLRFKRKKEEKGE